MTKTSIKEGCKSIRAEYLRDLHPFAIAHVISARIEITGSFYTSSVLKPLISLVNRLNIHNIGGMVSVLPA